MIDLLCQGYTNIFATLTPLLVGVMICSFAFPILVHLPKCFFSKIKSSFYYWNRDLKCVIFAGCSVLDVNDYNGNYKVDAWMRANDNRNGRNACAIVRDCKYIYFHKVIKGFYIRKEIMKGDW